MPTVIVHTPRLTPLQQDKIEALTGKLTAIKQHFQATVGQQVSRENCMALQKNMGIDINLVPDGFNPADIKLFISDMDSTLIAIECIDEIADMLDLKPQVSDITEAAMRGELDFNQSLFQRVALLKGLDSSKLEDVYNERLVLNPGAEKWVSGLKERGIAFALVSGGFTFFTDKLKNKLNLDYARANVLSIENGQLTGTVKGAVINAQAKADFLHELCLARNIKPHQVIAIGDGANDLLMMKEAGLSIAYNAKETVQKQAATVFNHSPLNAALDFLNIV